MLSMLTLCGDDVKLEPMPTKSCYTKRGHVYIYALVDPRDNIVRYVGQTYDLKKRSGLHLSAAKNTRHGANLLILWLRELLSLGLVPRIAVLEDVPSSGMRGALKREAFWVKHFRDQDEEQLTNNADGRGRWLKRPRDLPRMSAEEFSALRAKVGVSQAKLGSLMGYSESAVCLFESGKRSIPPRAAAAVLNLARIRPVKLPNEK